MSGFLAFAITLVAIAITIVILGVKVVPTPMRYTLERFGKFSRVLEPGLHLIIPLIDQIGHRLNFAEQVLDIPRQDVITKDNVVVQSDGVAYFQILDAPKAAYGVHGLEFAIQNLAMTNLRTVIGSMNLDEVLSERDKINTQLLNTIDNATNVWGVKVTRVEIKDIKPPADIVEAMTLQMKSEREKRALILEAEGKRRAAVEIAEGEKAAAILTAEGRLEAAKRDADARERLAEAEAKATDVVSKAIAQGNVQAVNYFLGLKYVEAMKDIGTAQNSKLVLMPLEAGGVVGSIAGIAELVKTVKNA